MKFLFSSSLSTAQKIKLVCALALYFKMDYTKISTWDGYYCSELLNRRLLQTELTEENPAVSGRMLQTSTYSVIVYYGVNTESSSDTTQAIINAAIANPTALVGTFLYT